MIQENLAAEAQAAQEDLAVETQDLAVETQVMMMMMMMMK
jgi:hypothetical protein